MAAGMEGAGRDKSIGVNIRLPFEQGANAFIAQDPKLVEMRYFFTRKLMLIKESDGYVVLPGGFGTLDEGFELLTLLQTGKAEPAPVVLLDVPGRRLLAGWDRFLARRGRAAGAGLGRRPGPLHGHRRRGRSCRRDPRLLPELPLVPLGRATCWCCGCRSHPTAPQLADLNRRFADIVAQRGHPPAQPPAARAGRPATTWTWPGWSSGSTRSTTAGCAS